MKKRVLSILVAGLLGVSLMAGCGSSDSSDSTAETDSTTEDISAEEETEEVADTSDLDFGEYSADNPLELKLSHFVSSDENQLAILANTFAENVEEASGGAVVVTVYGGGTLGNDQESLDSVIAGTLDCAVNNCPIMSGYDDGLSVLDLPYLFEDYDDVYAFLESDVCEQMRENFASTGARLLCMQCVGFRNLESSKGFASTPDDLAGLKIRVTSSEVFVNTWNAWGANALTMASTETLTALQQGTIDACDNVDNVAYTDGFYEYANYITVMEYATHFNGITMNADLFDSLTTDLQNVILEAAQDTATECTKNQETRNEENLQAMIDDGAEVSYDVDKDAFIEAAESVYDEYLASSATGAEYYEAITELLGE